MVAHVYTPVAGYNKVSYVGPSVTASALQKLCLFHPDSGRYTRPRAGWPLVVWMEMAGFQHTHIRSSIGPEELYTNPAQPDTGSANAAQAFLFRCLERGWAVAHCSVTVSFNGGTAAGAPGQVVGVNGVPAANIDYVFGTSTYDYGTAPDGNGICFSPGWANIVGDTYRDADGKTLAQGGIHPYQDVRRQNCLMDAEMIAQFINASAKDMGIDRNMIIGAGDSAGADVSCWCAYGPNRASARWLNPRGQELLSTQIYRGSFYKTWQPYFNMMTDAYTVIPGTCRHANSTSGQFVLRSGHWDLPAVSFLECEVTPITLARHEVAALDPVIYADPTMVANNLCFTYFTDPDTNTVGNWNTPTQGGITGVNPHNGYGHGLWKKLLGSRCQLYATAAGLNGNSEVVIAVATAGYAAMHNRGMNFLEGDLGMTRTRAFNPNLTRYTRV